MSYQLNAPPNPLSSPPRSQAQSSQASTISLSSTPSPYTRTQNALTQDMFGMQSTSSTPMDQHPQFLMSPPPQGRGHGSPYQQVVLINQVDQTQQQQVVAGRGKRATPKAKGGGGRKTPHTPVQPQAVVGEPVDTDEVQVVADMGAPAGGRRGGRPPPMDKEAKKERTRENEKERRQHQKTGMQRLRKLIPPPQTEDENAKKKIINDGMVVNQAADYIESLLKEIQALKTKTEADDIMIKKLRRAGAGLNQARRNDFIKYQRHLVLAKMDRSVVDETCRFAIRLLKKMEVATVRLKYYHEYAVKNPDKIKPADVDFRSLEVEGERIPRLVKAEKGRLEERYGEDTLKNMEQIYLMEQMDRERRESTLAIDGPSVEQQGVMGQVMMPGGMGQVMLPGSQQQQMHMAMTKQQYRQMHVAVSKQQHQMLMGVQGNQQAAVRAQVTQMNHQVNQVTKIIPPGMRLPNIGNPSNRPSQQSQVRFITLKQDANGEPQFLRSQGPNGNERQLQITGGNFIMTQSQNGQPLILRANDATQLYSLANLQQEHQASVGGQGGRVVMGVVKPQFFQNGGSGVQGQVRGPSVQGQGPRGPVIRPPQLQLRVVKRELFQDGDQGSPGQQQMGGGQGVQQQVQSPARLAGQRQQGPGMQAIHQQQQVSGGQAIQQQSPAGQNVQQQQGSGGQAIHPQQQGPGGQAIQQQQQGPGGQAIQQQQQGPRSRVIQRHQQGLGGRAIQQLLQCPGMPTIQPKQQSPAGQINQQQLGPGIQLIQQQQGPMTQAIQQQQGPGGIQHIRQQSPGAQAIPQQKTPASQTTQQQQGSGGQATLAQAMAPFTPGAPVMQMQPQQQGTEAQPTGLLAIKQEVVDDDGANAQQQSGGQTDQTQQQAPEDQHFSLATVKKETEDKSVEDQRAHGFMDDTFEPLFGDYNLTSMVDAMDGETGPLNVGMMGGLDSSFDLGLLGLSSVDGTLFSSDVSGQAGESMGSMSLSEEQGGSDMDGFSLAKVKAEPVDEDEDERMEEEEDTEQVDISRIKKEIDEDEEETDDQDGGSEDEVEAAAGPRRLPTWKLDGIGDEVVTERREPVDFTNCTVPIENLNVRRGELGASSAPTNGVTGSGEESRAAQVPTEGSLEYQVQMVTVEEWRDHDELFKKHPLFKHNFLWGEQKDPKKCEEVMAIIKGCWEEVVEERKAKDKVEAEEEVIKKMKVELDDDYEEKGKGKKGGSRGRRKRK